MGYSMQSLNVSIDLGLNIETTLTYTTTLNGLGQCIYVLYKLY